MMKKSSKPNGKKKKKWGKPLLKSKERMPTQNHKEIIRGFFCLFTNSLGILEKLHVEYIGIDIILNPPETCSTLEKLLR